MPIEGVEVKGRDQEELAWKFWPSNLVPQQFLIFKIWMIWEALVSYQVGVLFHNVNANGGLI